MENLKRYSDSAAVNVWLALEWFLAGLDHFRAWIPLAIVSLGIGFAIGYWLVGR
jgi:hypothetical protein